MAFRFLALIAFFGLLYASLGVKLYRLQIEQSFYYVEKAQARNEAALAHVLKRGQIFFTDRNDNRIQVAINRDFPIIYAVPKEIKDPAETASLLAPTIGWEEERLSNALNNPQSLFRLLIDRASEDQVRKIKELSLGGIYTDYTRHRFYPFQNLSSQLLGFVGINEEQAAPTGLYGIEKLHNAALVEGKDIHLTIDRTLQAEAEFILLNLISRFEAEGGTLIIQEPKTGKILAMTSKPDFDPNTYGRWPIKNFLNPAIQYIYEPGSVMKTITMAAGLDSGSFTPETIFVDNGSVTLNGKTIKNWDEKAYGRITITQILERSVNTGAVFAESKIGHKKFLDYLLKFGFSESTNIDLPDETIGNLKPFARKDARDIDFATAAFGQGIAVTPIGLINAFSAIANGGVLMKPYVNAEKEPQVIRRVISGEANHQVIEMMESAVEKAQVAVIPYYRVAGKTGTAQIPDFNKGGYTDQFIHTYVGLAPASDPKFVALIKLDKPNVQLAGMTVVPAFKELVQFILNYYRIPPDKL
jgi:cell division protein FtsI (penicillin-binding protein 3)/stage V sporulation protein D (sporulation-specific penicillin-binding protein)